MIERRVIDQIIERAEIADVVGDFVTLHKKGRDFIGLCPFHDDSRPSFNVSVSKNICKCFACGEGGTPLTFLMKHENFSFIEAIKYLGRKYGIEVIDQELSPEEQEKRSAREKLLHANNFAKELFATELMQGSEGRRIALSYFRERGLKDETIRTFELGYSTSAWDFLVQAAKEASIDFEVLDHLGLINKNKNGEWYDRYRERIIFPIHSISGNVVGFGGRILKKVEHVGKYINSPASDLYDKSKELYGFYFSKREISKKDKCLVLEGYMDVLSMYQRGVQNIVASSGTALTPQQVQLIKRYTSNVTLVFDADNAGLNATLKGLDTCLQKGMNVQILRLPEGEDPDSFAKTHTLEDIEAYISSHEEDGIHFKMRTLTEQWGSDPQSKAKVIDELAESISLIEELISRELYTNAISEKMEVSVDALTQKVEQIRQDRELERRRAHIREVERQQAQQATDRGRAGGESVPNLSTQPFIPTKGKAAHKEKAPKLEHPLNTYEVILLRDLMLWGTRFMNSCELNDGSLGASVIDLIYDQTLDLRSENLLTPPFAQLLDDLIQEQESTPEFNPMNFISWYDDPSILYFSNLVLTHEEKLSPLHDGYVLQMEKEYELEKMIYTDITSYKYAIIESEIASLIRQLSDPKISSDEGGAMKILGRIKELNETKQLMANSLGDRTITPRERLK